MMVLKCVCVCIKDNSLETESTTNNALSRPEFYVINTEFLRKGMIVLLFP